MKSIKTAIAIVCLLCIHSAFAQYTEVINSNRPGVSRSAFSVGTNVAQLEVGPYILNEEHTPLKYEVSGFGVDFSARYGLLFEELELNVEGTFQSDKFTDNRSGISATDNRANFKTLPLVPNTYYTIPIKMQRKTSPTSIAGKPIKNLNGIV